jgi:hypothetical protein
MISGWIQLEYTPCDAKSWAGLGNTAKFHFQRLTLVLGPWKWQFLTKNTVYLQPLSRMLQTAVAPALL